MASIDVDSLLESSLKRRGGGAGEGEEINAEGVHKDHGHGETDNVKRAEEGHR